MTFRDKEFKLIENIQGIRGHCMGQKKGLPVMRAITSLTLAAILSALLALGGCGFSISHTILQTPPAVSSQQSQKPASGLSLPALEAFLERYKLQVQGTPSRFTVNVPENWDAPLGSYPVGLYWRLANVYSRGAGLDLTRLKGQTVEVWRYHLAGGLPGEDGNSSYTYPSDVVLLVQKQRVVGAWLSFNNASVGPSVTKRGFEDITGMTFGSWVDRQIKQKKLFINPGKNSDLASLGPVGVLNAFCEAVNQGNRTRAYACLTPNELLDYLVINNDTSKHLYNPDFGSGPGIYGLLKARLVSYSIYNNPHSKAQNRPTVDLGAFMDLKWVISAFNTPNKLQERFVSLRKYADGWKIDGFGTGP